jgi:hypothetical protein
VFNHLGERAGSKEVFCFEKKNQKTFAPGFRAPARSPRLVVKAPAQKFFGSFFQRRTLPYSFLEPQPSCLVALADV